jgi:hypothetical protein
MATSFGALCTDFYINQKIVVKMDLPGDRETVLHFFDRVRTDHSEMTRFRRYTDELALESSRRDGSYKWMAIRRNSIRAGHVNPDTLTAATDFHRLILRTCPYHLSLSPLDIDQQELVYGFDLECGGNQHEIIYEALLANTPLGALIEEPGAAPVDVQPILGITLSDGIEAIFEVKATTSSAMVRAGRFRPGPISILLSLRRRGPIEKVEDLLAHYDIMRDHGERLCASRLVPDLLAPISRAITSST